MIMELKNIYHHRQEGKKRKSSERNSDSIHPYGRYGNAGKTSKTISTIAILWPVKAIFEKRAATVEVDTFISPDDIAKSEKFQGATGIGATGLRGSEWFSGLAWGPLRGALGIENWSQSAPIRGLSEVIQEPLPLKPRVLVKKSVVLVKRKSEFTKTIPWTENPGKIWRRAF